MDAFRILVVDDEPDLERLLLQRMRREIRVGHYLFVFARNGVEALERLSWDDEIDVVITDINMPEMDGLTLLKQIPPVDPPRHFRTRAPTRYAGTSKITTCATEAGRWR